LNASGVHRMLIAYKPSRIFFAVWPARILSHGCKGCAVGGYFVLYRKLLPTSQQPTPTPTPKVSTKTDSNLQNILFSLPAKHLNVYSLLKNGYKPDDIVSATLLGNFYDPPQSLSVIARSNGNISTPLNAMGTFFSANKSGDVDWIVSLWVPEEQQESAPNLVENLIRLFIKVKRLAR